MTILNTCTCGGSVELPNFDCERCRLVWFVLTVRDMRTQQREFFKTSKAEHMHAAKRLEKTVDKAVGRLTGVATQQELFSQGG